MDGRSEQARDLEHQTRDPFLSRRFRNFAQHSSLARPQVKLKGDTAVEGCQGAHSSNSAHTEEKAAEHTVDITDALTAQLPIFLSTDSV